MERQIINPLTWQDQFGFVQANQVSGVQRYLVCSGQTSVDADGTPVHVGDMAGQINQALDNLETVLKQGDFSMSDVIRLNYYTTDVDAFLEAAQVAGQRLAESGCVGGASSAPSYMGGELMDISDGRPIHGNIGAPARQKRGRS